jgi:hypothetical protein
LSQGFEDVVNDWADEGVRKGLADAKDEFVLVQMRERAAILRPNLVDAARIVGQERARPGLEEIPVVVFGFHEVFSDELFRRQAQMIGETLAFVGLQERRDDLAAVGAPAAVDLLGSGFVKPMYDRIDLLDR